MQNRDLLRWRAMALGTALWSLEQNDRHWEQLEAVCCFTPSEVATTLRGKTIENTRILLPRDERPSFLLVRVPALAEMGIDQHAVEIIRGDYRAALKRLSQREHKALMDYLHKPRLSHSHGYKETRRTVIMPDGSRLVQHFRRVGRNDAITKELESALLHILAAAQVSRWDSGLE